MEDERKAGDQGTGQRATRTPDPATLERARSLAAEHLLVDTHIDVPYRLGKGDEDISQRTPTGDFDYPRGVEGGLNAAFMSIYIPASYQEGGAFDFANETIDMVEGWVERWPDLFASARSPEELLERFEQGVMALPLGMENGAAIEGDLAKLQHFYDRGIRYITLTHGENNHICDSSYATEKKWGGLSPFGRELIAEMNRLGILIDVSHISDEAFDQVIELTEAPVIASHSSARHFTPGWERNISDEMIRRVGKNGGVVHVNFGSAFLTQAANDQLRPFYEALFAFQEKNGLEDDDPRLAEFEAEYWGEREKIYATVADVADHIDHIVGLTSVDHVGIGSDYDGVGDSLPVGLKDVSQYPNLVAELILRGYSDEEIAKILGGNLIRAWEQVEAVAESLGDRG